MDTSDYRQVPEKILRRAKEWSLLYPEEIEFQEGYFGLLFARLEYAQANDMRNEQRRMFREMRLVAERANYSQYEERNEMLETIAALQQVYGYQ